MYPLYASDEETRATFEDHIHATSVVVEEHEVYALTHPSIARVLRPLVALFQDPDAFKIEYCYEEFTDLLCMENSEGHGKMTVSTIFHMIEQLPLSTVLPQMTHEASRSTELADSWREFLVRMRSQTEKYCAEGRDLYERIARHVLAREEGLTALTLSAAAITNRTPKATYAHVFELTFLLNAMVTIDDASTFACRQRALDQVYMKDTCTQIEDVQKAIAFVLANKPRHVQDTTAWIDHVTHMGLLYVHMHKDEYHSQFRINAQQIFLGLCQIVSGCSRDPVDPCLSLSHSVLFNTKVAFLARKGKYKHEIRRLALDRINSRVSTPKEKALLEGAWITTASRYQIQCESWTEHCEDFRAAYESRYDKDS